MKVLHTHAVLELNQYRLRVRTARLVDACKVQHAVDEFSGTRRIHYVAETLQNSLCRRDFTEFIMSQRLYSFERLLLPAQVEVQFAVLGVSALSALTSVTVAGSGIAVRPLCSMLTRSNFAICL